LASPTDYTYDSTSKTISFTAAYINTLLGTGVSDVSKVLTVAFTDAAHTTAPITLSYTAPNIVPSINPTTATLTAASSVAITVNFGSGTGLASGITSIKNASGTALSVGTDYTVTGTALTLTTTYVDSLIGSGSTSFAKALTVTFTNSATTTATIDLSYTATVIAAPTITVTSAGLITLSNLSSSALYTSTMIGVGTDLYAIDPTAITLDTSGYSASTGGKYIIQLKTAYFTFYSTKDVLVNVTLSNGTVLHGHAILN